MSPEEICYFCGRSDGDLVIWLFGSDRRTTHTECWLSSYSTSPHLPTPRESAAV